MKKKTMERNSILRKKKKKQKSTNFAITMKN